MKKDKESEGKILRVMATGLINSPEYAREIVPNLDVNLIDNPEMYYIITWCKEFFDKYNKVPGRDIDDIYYQKKDAGEIPGDLIDSIGDLLKDLALEHEEDFHVDYAIDRTRQYFRQRHIENHIQQIKEHLIDFNLDAAYEVAETFVSINGSVQSGLEKVMYDSSNYIRRRIPKPVTLLHPWLSEQSLNLVYGPRGAGKTWLCSIIAMALTRENAQDVPQIGPWRVDNSCRTLFIDGEMNNYMLQERIRELNRPLPKQDQEHPLYVLSGHDFSNEHGRQLNLDRSTRTGIYEYLKSHREFRLLILDNASALTPGIVENSKEEWDPVNQWLISLRHLGISVILVHHSSKEGKQRGTSGREDAMDTIIKVDKHKEHSAEDYSWFTVSFQKARNLKPGASKRDFSLRIVPHPDGGLTWEEDETGEITGQRMDIVLDLLIGELDGVQIASKHKVSKQYVHKIKTGYCIDKGWLTQIGPRRYETTDKGLDFIELNG